jgi:hypothetical protein
MRELGLSIYEKKTDWWTRVVFQVMTTCSLVSHYPIRLHGVITWKTIIYITTVVKTSNQNRLSVLNICFWVPRYEKIRSFTILTLNQILLRWSRMKWTRHVVRTSVRKHGVRSGHRLEHNIKNVVLRNRIRWSRMDPTRLRPVQWRALAETVIKLRVP